MTFPSSVRQLAQRISSGDVSSQELVRQSLDAIKAHNAALNAFVSHDEEGAMRVARQRDAERRKGNIRSALHGIPVAVKDIIDLKGQVTSLGSSLYLDNVAHKDAKVIQLLRRAGAVVVGKTTLHEFAYGATGDRSTHGPSHNPYDRTRISGGSSGGSAVAVAAGIVPLSFGTDTAGSVRVPAGLCGVMGFKPAYGAISTLGVFPLAGSLDHLGLFSRTTDDAQLVYRLLAHGKASNVEAGITDARIGWLDAGTSSPVDARILQIIHDRMREWRRTPQPIALPDVRELGFDSTFDLFSTIQASEAALIHRHDIARGAGVVDDEVLQRLQAGTEVRAWRFLQSVEARARLSQAVSELFQSRDILVSPNVGITAPLIGERTALINGVAVELRSTLLAFTHVWNLVGYPAISVPIGLVDGLPVSVQLITRPGNEHHLFPAASRIEVPGRVDLR